MSNRPYRLYCDSTCDLNKEALAKMDVKILQLQYEVDGETFTGDQLPMEEFYRRMRADAVTKTSQISTGTYIDAFEEDIKAG